MSYSPFLPDGQWPLAYLPSTLFQYFLHTVPCSTYEDLVHLYERKTFIKALNSTTKLPEFWAILQERYPEKKDYFLSLINEEEPYDSYWIRCEYDSYLKRKAFEEWSEKEKRALEKDFGELRPAVYRAVLEGEARRLNRSVAEMSPINPLIPWKADNDEDSPLAKLPQEIFGRLFSELNTVDIFKMTLVCRKWRSLVYNNSKQLNRAEHAVTTHLITFTGWMDPPKTPPCATFLRQYQLFNLCLMRWYCETSDNLETLIVDHPISYTYLATLLQSCPNLKHLRIANDSEITISQDKIIPLKVNLRKLEVFLYSVSYSTFSYGSCILPRHLHRDVLVSSENLQVYRGSLNTEDLSLIHAQKPVTNVFSKLIALDLHTFTPSVLEVLAHIDNMQLSYLKLGHFDSNSEWDRANHEERARNAVHRLLPKLDKLEILVTSTSVGITNATIQLLVDMKLSLSLAVLYHAYIPSEVEEEEWNVSIEVDPLQPNVLKNFQNMLTSNNPGIDLSEIQFVLVEGEALDSLEAVDTSFTFLTLFDDNYARSSNVDLYDPQMQRRLGIEF